MHQSLIETSAPTRALFWRDTLTVIGVTALSFIVAAYFNLNEALYAFTRAGERFQLDELPVGMVVLMAGLIWMSWRRYQHACRELRARQIAEARLVGVLAENRQLTQENVRIQEVERKHLARELHDELGQYLNAIKLDAVSICESGDSEPEFATNAALAIVSTVDHVHGAVSDMIARLRPVGLDELGLVAAVECCVDHWRQRLPDTSFAVSVHGDFEGMSESLNLTVYRLIQEGLTNVYKHANAQQVSIVLERLSASHKDGDSVRVRLADNGGGMESTPRKSRFGLTGMRERVEMAGGSFTIESAPGLGLQLEARLPVSEEK